MRAARTKKPCPGCGGVDAYRKADSVCAECRQLMRDGRTYRANTKKDRTLEPVLLPWAPHSLPYIHYGDEIGRQIQTQVSDLAKFLSVPGPETGFDYGARKLISGTDGYYYQHDENCVLLPAGFADRLESLYKTIIAACDHAHRNGVDRGSNILVELVENKMAIQEFNERVIREGRKSEEQFNVKTSRKKK